MAKRIPTPSSHTASPLAVCCDTATASPCADAVTTPRSGTGSQWAAVPRHTDAPGMWRHLSLRTWPPQSPDRPTRSPPEGHVRSATDQPAGSPAVDDAPHDNGTARARPAGASGPVPTTQPPRMLRDHNPRPTDPTMLTYATYPGTGSTRPLGTHVSPGRQLRRQTPTAGSHATRSDKPRQWGRGGATTEPESPHARVVPPEPVGRRGRRANDRARCRQRPRQATQRTPRARDQHHHRRGASERPRGPDLQTND